MGPFEVFDTDQFDIPWLVYAELTASKVGIRAAPSVEVLISGRVCFFFYVLPVRTQRFKRIRRKVAGVASRTAAAAF